MVKITAAVVAADFGRLGEQVKEAETAGVDMIHVDVVDGHFAPVITAGPVLVRGIRKHTTLPIDVHLMVEDETPYLQPFAEAGADILTVHLESKADAVESFRRIRQLGKTPGIAITPATPFSSVTPYLGDVKFLLVMTVNPGPTGQAFQPAMVNKIRQARMYLDKNRLAVDLIADGGINVANAAECVKAGATVLVAGSAVFSGDVEQGVASLRAAAESPRGNR